MFKVPERDCCLLSFPHPRPKQGDVLSLSQVGLFTWTPTPVSPGKPEPLLLSPGLPAPEYLAHLSRRLWPRLLASGADGQAARLAPTFSWALLNFFCTCLAKRPAAPPALPSAILPAPRRWPARAGALWFSGGPQGGSEASRHASHPALVGGPPTSPRGLLVLQARPCEPTERPPRGHATAALRPP